VKIFNSGINWSALEAGAEENNWSDKFVKFNTGLLYNPTNKR